MVDRADILSPSPILVLPPKGQLIETSELDFTCQRSKEDLVLLSTHQEIKKNVFMTAALGQMNLSSLPDGLLPVPILTGIMEEMRDASAASDIELHGGIYDGEASYLALNRPSHGGFDVVDNYYYAGPIPVVDGYTMVVDIHSHPLGLRFRLESPSEIKAGKNVPSQYDFGQLLYLSNVPQHNQLQSAIIIGQEIVSLFLRTKQTAPKTLHKDKEGHWVFADVINRLLRIDREIKEGQPKLTPLSQRLMAIEETCRQYQLGWYLMRLRHTGSHDTLWARFNPWPKDITKAMDILLG